MPLKGESEFSKKMKNMAFMSNCRLKTWRLRTCSFLHIYDEPRMCYDVRMSGESVVEVHMRSELPREAVYTQAQLAEVLGYPEVNLRSLLRTHHIRTTGKVVPSPEHRVLQVTYFIEEVRPYTSKQKHAEQGKAGGAFAWLRWLLSARHAFLRAIAADPTTYHKLRAILDEYARLEAEAAEAAEVARLNEEHLAALKELR